MSEEVIENPLLKSVYGEEYKRLINQAPELKGIIKYKDLLNEDLFAYEIINTYKKLKNKNITKELLLKKAKEMKEVNKKMNEGVNWEEDEALSRFFQDNEEELEDKFIEENQDLFNKFVRKQFYKEGVK